MEPGSSLPLSYDRPPSSVPSQINPVRDFPNNFLKIHFNIILLSTPRGHAVAQLVEALRYTPEGHGFESRLFHWNFSLI
jgi:hypothetical protein